MGDRQVFPVHTMRISMARNCTGAGVDPHLPGPRHAAYPPWMADVVSPMRPEKHPEPALAPGPIPTERYLSPAYAQLEWDRMWTKVWHWAGPVSDVAEPGDYFTYEIGPESILVVNTGDGIQALYNVCQHRGYALRNPGCGHAQAFQCPYHLWTYALDGTLTAVPDADDFSQGDPTGRRNLVALRTAVWNGFVFVCMDPEAEPLREHLGVVADHLESYDWAETFHLTQDYVMTWECNWKVGVDAFNEVYHVQGIHPELLPFTDDVDCPIDIFGRHSRFQFRVGRPSPRWTDDVARRHGYAGRDEPSPELAGMMRAAGLDPDTWQGDLDDVRPLLQAARRAQGAEKGFAYDRMVDEQLTDDFHYFVFPNVTLNISADHFWWFRHRPHPTDPNKMFWDYQQWVRLPAGTPPPERPETVHCAFGDGAEQDLHLALRQDAAAAEPLQRGMRSQGLGQLYLADQERRLANFHRVLQSYIEGAPIDQGAEAPSGWTP